MTRFVASRPHMPSYGLLAADEGGGLLPLAWAEERLARARNFWVATVRPSGAPHLTAVWGEWMDDAFWFSAAGDSRKVRNLLADGRCCVATEDAAEPVIVEGTVTPVTDPADVTRFDGAILAKYDFDGAAMPKFVGVLHPERLFGFVEAEERFAGAATRWTAVGPSPDSSAP